MTLMINRRRVTQFILGTTLSPLPPSGWRARKSL